MDRTELYRVSTQILENIINDEKNDNNILFDMDIWDWSQGVALYGIWKYYRLTGERRYLEYLTQWFDTKLNRPIVHNINTMAPLLTLCFLYEETGREEYRDYCESCAEWLLDGLPKTEMGGFQHVTIDSDNNQQLWADTVFMAVLFMGKIASITGDERYAGECKKQFMLHIHYLSDKKTGLWCHGWSFERMDNYAGAFWARGNCWFTIAAAELPGLLELEEWESDLILDAYRAQAAALCRYQSPDGLWHTLVDREDSYLEVSGSSGFAYGLLKGVRAGLLPASCRDAALRAAQAVRAHIGPDGLVGQVSYGTIVADTLEYYKNVPLRPTGYGQNLALMMQVELLVWDAQGLL
ncbi:glycoside hydrolase family 88/105 protein [Ruthenibacterium lactatiformans]|uniref:glycoside hydrolase family 88/105 protein n=1 Tax=Ruthenibacterium lactatiformans TaxID=1550024 RepID=UPI00266D8E6B|nr:glycoside hydrolase family 88 protein [Ruthenibacterium lactatiformans]